MAGILDTFIAFKFVEILANPWEEQEAFKFGIIDKDGKVLRKGNKLRTSKEKNSFTSFHKIIFNIKRLMNKFGFSNRISSYAAALFLLKENQKYNMENNNLLVEEFKNFLIKNRNSLNEGNKEMEELGLTVMQVRNEVKRQLRILKGNIPEVVKTVKQLLNLKDLNLDNSGNIIFFNESLSEEVLKKGKYKLSRDTISGKKGDEIIVKKDTKPVDKILGIEVFSALTKKNQEVIVSKKELIKENVPTNNVGMGNISGVVPGEDPPGPPNFANTKVFKVSPEIFRRFRLGKGRYERWNKYLDMEEEECQAIYNFVLENPGKPIIIQNNADSTMFFTRNYQAFMNFKEWSKANNK